MPLAPTQRDLEIVKLSKSDGERQIKDIASMWNLKNMVQMNSFTKQKQSLRVENKLRVTKEKSMGGINWEHMHTTV